MILTEKVLIRISPSSYKHFKNLGYDVFSGKFSLVSVKDLLPYSKIKINVKCDICGLEKILSYVDYRRNLKYELYTCSEKCSKIKKEKTCIIKYGVTSPQKSIEIKKKSRETSMIKYGVGSPNQDKSVFEKQQISGFKMKKHDSGIKYRGRYELDFIEFCISNKIKIENAPSIKYHHEGETHIYFPDFFIPKYNLIIEIKSQYYYDKYLLKNIEKRKGCLKIGYDYLFIIDKKYENLISKIKN